jgi:hypothetical protein
VAVQTPTGKGKKKNRRFSGEPEVFGLPLVPPEVYDYRPKEIWGNRGSSGA